MRSIYNLPYRLSITLFISLLMVVPARAEVDIVTNGALNFFFSHGAISISLGTPIYLHSDREIRRSSRYQQHHYSHQNYSSTYLVTKRPLKRSYKHYPYSPRVKYQTRNNREHNKKGYKQQYWQYHRNDAHRPIRARKYSNYEKKHKYFRSKEYR